MGIALLGLAAGGCNGGSTADYEVVPFRASPLDAGPTNPSAPSACGDGELDRGEECDDGNLEPGDGCTRFCSLEGVCGDGTVQRGEQCDDGNLEAADGCTRFCTTEGSCGDGDVNRGEECDDANTTSGDGCSASCLSELADDAGVPKGGNGGEGGGGGEGGDSMGTGGAGGPAGASGGGGMGGGTSPPQPACLPLPLPPHVDPTCRCLDRSVDLDVNSLEDCAQTLVQNPQLTTSTDGWSTQGSIRLGWNERNRGAADGVSGSLDVELTLVLTDQPAAPDAGVAAPIADQFVVSGSWQCVRIQPNTNYRLLANYFIDDAEPTSTSAGASIFAYTSTDCSGTFTNAFQSLGGARRNAWGEISDTYLSPFGSNSVRLRLNTNKRFVDPPASTLWDNVLFAPIGLCGNGVLEARETCDPPNPANCSGHCRLFDACLGCQNLNCPAAQAACFESSDLTAAGLNKSNLCQQAFDCMRESECAEAAVEACYCGVGENGTVDVPTTQACLAGMGNGACRGAIEEAAETTAALEVAVRLYDSTFALGRASQLITCSETFCEAECGPRPVCGNGGLVEFGEECDDGNPFDLDGCSSFCKLECGNGIVESTEQCDDGNRTPGDGCDEECFEEVPCGDGVVSGREECDDGNTVSCDGCAYPACTIERCGNGRRECSEECDDASSARCSDQCEEIVCGDGVIEGEEQCDDGQLPPRDCDGCSSTCTREECGNGIVECRDIPSQFSEDCEPPGTATCSSECVTIHAGGCPDCEMANCPDRVADAEQPPRGQPGDAALVADLLACARETNCAAPPAAGVDVCYCGTAPIAVCLTGGAIGACKAESEAAAGTMDPIAISELFGDPSVPIGNAYRLLSCDRQFCSSISIPPNNVCFE